MRSKFFDRFIQTALTVFCSVLVGGCAIQTDRRGQFQFQVDDAEIFGQTVKTFNLPDGSEARLRVLNGQFSIKLQKYLRVIPIENATEVKVRSTAMVDGRGIIVIDKVERGCSFRSQLLSIKGIEVLGWDFGDCQSTPAVSLYPNAATFDFRGPRSTTRYTYQNSRLVRNEYYGVPPALQTEGASAVTSDARRHMPGLPSAPGEGRPVAHAGNAADAGVNRPITSQRPSPARQPPPAPGSPRVPPPAPSTAMNFPAQEQKPVRIVLDN